MIRPATAADREAVVALWKACGLTRPYYDAVGDFDRAVTSTQSAVFVVERDGVIVGSMLLGDDSHRGWVYYLAADPARRGQGIGRALMEASEAWLAAHDLPKIQFMVRGTNTAVLAFYDHLGYEPQDVVVLGRRLD